MGDPRLLPETIKAKRSDPVYMAHAYLTKVPLPAILPFIEAFSSPGDTVADPFAGSGMTGVAATLLGRNARLFDVSVLGRHIGANYVNLVEPDQLREAAASVVRSTHDRLGNVYAVECGACGSTGELAKTVWSSTVQCATCRRSVNFYRSLESAEWDKREMRCPDCKGLVTSRSRKLNEEPVVDWIRCSCSDKQLEQAWSEPTVGLSATDIDWPDLEIDKARQMFIASALGRHGLTSTARFFSRRNLLVLGALKSAIDETTDEAIRQKLLFAFTAILTRASKRYQWSRKRPLNAANANYYVAPVFYEWNVLDLFSRKVEAVIRSDDWIRAHREGGPLFRNGSAGDVTYDLASAAELPLPDNSVDYIFTDPPFGSNIFYSDMNLFHEAWLGSTTDPAAEAVVDRVQTDSHRSAARYEQLLTEALAECKRVLKDAGCISMIFGNSAGAMWQLVQRAIRDAGLQVVPEHTAVLDKGQRSVKGLASGFENVATLDLVLTMKPGEARTHHVVPRDSEISAAVDELLMEPGVTPSHLYLEMLRRGFREGWDLGALDLRTITEHIRASEREIDPRTSAVS